MNNTEIKSLVFDVGDVLIRFRYRDHMRDLGFNEETVDFLSENMVLTEFWNDMDRGIRMEEDAIQHFTALYPKYREEILTFWSNTEGLVSEYPYSAPLLRQIKSLGYTVYILSNYPVEIARRHWPKFKFLPEADGYIISGFEKMVKPEARFFLLLTERFGVELKNSLFIDDRPVNLEGAKAVGMKTLHFTGYEKLLEDLKTFGIL